MKDSFVFYRSFWEVLKSLPQEKDVLYLLKSLCLYALDDVEPDLPYPLSSVFIQMKANLDASGKRYDKAVEDGQKGGRPRKWVNQAEAEMLYADLRSWKKVAEELDVSSETLRKARLAWNSKKPKNLNDNVNDNLNVNEKLSLINKEPRPPAAGPSGPPAATAKKELRPPPLPIPERRSKGDEGTDIR